MSTWTKKAPTKAGYYWCRSQGFGPAIQEVLDDDGELFIFDGCDDYPVDEWSCEWWPEPIQTPAK